MDSLDLVLQLHVDCPLLLRQDLHLQTQESQAGECWSWKQRWTPQETQKLCHIQVQHLNLADGNICGKIFYWKFIFKFQIWRTSWRWFCSLLIWIWAPGLSSSSVLYLSVSVLLSIFLVWESNQWETTMSLIWCQVTLLWLLQYFDGEIEWTDVN